MSTVKSRLKEVMDAMGIDKYTPATTCEGVTKSMLQNLWNSPTDTITSNVLEPFCKRYPTVSCNYLLRGEGPMFEDDIEGIENNTNKYFEICKLLLENKERENELYSKIAEMIGVKF